MEFYMNENLKTKYDEYIKLYNGEKDFNDLLREAINYSLNDKEKVDFRYLTRKGGQKYIIQKFDNIDKLTYYSIVRIIEKRNEENQSNPKYKNLRLNLKDFFNFILDLYSSFIEKDIIKKFLNEELIRSIFDSYKFEYSKFRIIMKNDRIFIRTNCPYCGMDYFYIDVNSGYCGCYSTNCKLGKYKIDILSMLSIMLKESDIYIEKNKEEKQDNKIYNFNDLIKDLYKRVIKGIEGKNIDIETINRKRLKIKQKSEKLEKEKRNYINDLHNNLVPVKEEFLQYAETRGLKREFLLSNNLCSSLELNSDNKFKKLQNRLLFNIYDEKGNFVGVNGRSIFSEEDLIQQIISNNPEYKDKYNIYLKYKKYKKQERLEELKIEEIKVYKSFKSMLNKSLNSWGTPTGQVIYNLSNVLSRRNLKYIIIVEGIIDCLLIEQTLKDLNIDYVGAIATFTNKLTDQQILLLNKYVRSTSIELIFAYDKDKAGLQGNLINYYNLYTVLTDNTISFFKHDNFKKDFGDYNNIELINIFKEFKDLENEKIFELSFLTSISKYITLNINYFGNYGLEYNNNNIYKFLHKYFKKNNFKSKQIYEEDNINIENNLEELIKNINNINHLDNIYINTLEILYKNKFYNEKIFDLLKREDTQYYLLEEMKTKGVLEFMEEFIKYTSILETTDSFGNNYTEIEYIDEFGLEKTLFLYELF